VKSIVTAIFILIGCSAAAQTVKPALPDFVFIEPQPIQMEPMAVLDLNVYSESTPTIVAANALPYAPAAASAVLAESIESPSPRAMEFKSFSTNKFNRMLVMTEFWGRGLDALSTHQNLTNGCACYREASRFFGLDMAPVFKSSIGAYSYSFGIAATYSLVSAKLWNASKNHPHHARLLRSLSRALLIGDSSMEVTADMHNLSIMDPGPSIN
jgi:hypothetical protein